MMEMFGLKLLTHHMFESSIWMQQDFIGMVALWQEVHNTLVTTCNISGHKKKKKLFYRRDWPKFSYLSD